MAKTKLSVVGPHGRLGSRICALAAQEDSLELVSGLIRASGKESDTTGGSYTSDISAALSVAQVVVDVSAPSACLDILPTCISHQVAYVCGSTGLNAQQISALKAAALEIPILVASNFSIGVNVLRKLVADAGRLLGNDFEPEIFEIHHGKKRDAPSGTAMSLGQELKKSRGDLVDVFDRSGKKDERGIQELGYAALRGGDVAGEHTVFFFGESERVELTHRATSRDIFARGALRAASFIHTQEAGLYGMQDVLGIQA